MIKRILIFSFIGLFSSCVPIAQPEKKSKLEFEDKESSRTQTNKKNNPKIFYKDEGSSNHELRFIKAYTVIKNKCSSCHTSSIHNIFNSLDSSEKWVQNKRFITPGSSATSSLITRLKNNGSNMPIAAEALSSEEVFALTDWIDNLKASSKPQVNFYRPLIEKVEKNGVISMSVTLSSALSVNTSVNILVNSTSTLTEGLDYTFTNKRVSFLAGETSKVFFITLKDDTLKENTENLDLSLELADQKLIIGLNNNSQLKLLDNDNLTGITLNNSAIEAHLPDRLYITSFLLHVFGPKSEANIDKYINDNHELFGSKCDLYERSLGNDNNGTPSKIWDDPLEFKEVAPCSKSSYGESLKTKSFERSNALREAWIVNFCENTMKSNDDAVIFALANKSLNKSSNVNKTNTSLMFDLFYPGKEMPSDFGTALIDLANTNPLRKWELVLLTLCLSPEWQVP